MQNYHVLTTQQELGMSGRQLFRSAFSTINDNDHPLHSLYKATILLYKKYKQEFPKGDPLICACEKNRIKDVENMIKILLETNNKNVINNEGKTSQGISFTPLGIAARKGYLNIVQLLIENGVDSSICSKRDKWNVLHIAAYYSKTSSNVVEYLLKHLPEKVINQKDVCGETPLDNAYSNPYRVKDEIVACIIKYKQNVKKKEEDERKRKQKKKPDERIRHRRRLATEKHRRRLARVRKRKEEKRNKLSQKRGFY